MWGGGGGGQCYSGFYYNNIPPFAGIQSFFPSPVVQSCFYSEYLILESRAYAREGRRTAWRFMHTDLGIV